MSTEFNRRSTDNAEPNFHNPEWLHAVTVIAPIAMSFFQLLMSMVNARPPKKIPTTPAMPLVENDTSASASTT